MTQRPGLTYGHRTFVLLSFLFFAVSLVAARTQPASRESVQSEIVDYGKFGKIKIEAWETRNHASQLVFTSASGRILETMSFHVAVRGNFDHIRFRVMHIEGLPDPLILAVANTNGASDCFYSPIPIARVDGSFRRLLADSPEMDTQGGFSLGSLGTRGGIGLAIWTFEWGPNESHYDNHRYEIKFYQWNRTSGKFENSGSHLTKKLDVGSDAALGSGISPEDIIDVGTLQEWFPEYSC